MPPLASPGGSIFRGSAPPITRNEAEDNRAHEVAAALATKAIEPSARLSNTYNKLVLRRQESRFQVPHVAGLAVICRFRCSALIVAPKPNAAPMDSENFIVGSAESTSSLSALIAALRWSCCRSS